ncbi:WbqC family protein [Cytobacillus praedii]|uniref:WbqC family protein n=1 Tax=Cytobacillus praedii TaxID=1742358 RepID=UPI00071094C2|nr:WbqC family protein [Cytobacillus praedii]
MRIAVMQPYLFPYIGYFQLIHDVDKFVIYDDVQYIKGGWINRNKLLVNNQEYMFTFSVQEAEMKAKINDRCLSTKFLYEKDKFIKTISQNYKKAPYFSEAFDLILEILTTEERNLSDFIYQSILKINKYLEIDTEVLRSSNLPIRTFLNREEKLIDIVKRLNGNVYINSIGGIKLYSKENFKREGIDVYFLNSKPFLYFQYREPFIPNLSVIDALMFNSKEELKDLLNNYELV